MKKARKKKKVPAEKPKDLVLTPPPNRVRCRSCNLNYDAGMPHFAFCARQSKCDICGRSNDGETNVGLGKCDEGCGMVICEVCTEAHQNECEGPEEGDEDDEEEEG